MNRRTLLLQGLSTVIAPALGAYPAWGQGKYPERPIRLVIPYPPGGVNDAVGRPWADRMKPLLGTVVIENIGGAGGTIGVAAVARAQPDGYAILIGNNGNLVITPIAASKPIYSPTRDFEMICRLVTTGLAFAVHPSLPVRNMKELVQYARNNPGKLSYGSPGNGTTNHLAGEMFKLVTKADIVHVPYRGVGPATTDLLGGQIPLMVAVVTGQLLELHRASKLNVLAVTTPERLKVAPDIPTAIEAGIPEMTAQGFNAVLAPKGTPKTIIERIAQVTRTAMADKDLQQVLIANGFEPDLDSSPEKMRRFLEDEIARWTPVIRAIGLKVD